MCHLVDLSVVSDLAWKTLIKVKVKFALEEAMKAQRRSRDTARWAPGPVCMGAEDLAPTGIRSLDHLSCS
jgi:hypothetical protein